MKKQSILIYIILILCIGILGGCASGTKEDEADYLLSGQQDVTGRRVEFIFEYEEQSTMGSNQLAIWIEDEEGQFVDTVYASQWTALGGYEMREMSLANWVRQANPSSLSQTQLDAISSATPKSGVYKVVWDCADSTGLDCTGTYFYVVEGSTYMEEYVLFQGEMTLGATALEERPDSEFSVAEPQNKNMLTGVIVRYYPE